MAQTDVISKIFAKELKRKISDKPRLPFSMFANWEYERELKQAGDTVIVPISPKIVMDDASADNAGDLKKTTLSGITATDRVVTKSELTIDKLHRYREKFSSLEEIQTSYFIKGNRMKDLRVAIDVEVEKGIIAVLKAMLLANTGNSLTASATLTEDNIAKEIMRLRTAMSKKDIPMDNRILVVSPDVSALIAMAKIINGTDTGSDSAVDGWLGKFAGFKIFESNLIEDGEVFAFRSGAYNYVRQMVVGKVTEATDAAYYNILGEIAHGGKVFDQNIEQIFQLKNI